MARKGYLRDVDIRGLEIVSKRPLGCSGHPKGRPLNTVGVIGKAIKGRDNSFEVDWADDKSKPNTLTGPCTLTWDEIGQRVGPKALQGREIVVEDEDDKTVIARILGRQAESYKAKYEVRVLGKTSKMTMTWSQIGEALAKRREMELRMVALGQSGRLENMTCTPCMPVFNEGGETPEVKGNTR